MAKKTFVTSMPDHVGAFLKASRCFADLNINITRVSYNKAVDIHTLFIEAEGPQQDLEKAASALATIGYLLTAVAERSVLLLEFKLRDEPGSVTRVLELIQKYAFNISYISSQGDGSEYQHFKMGLFVEDPSRVSHFLQEASQLCAVRVVDYDKLERSFDNSIFYISFANELAVRLALDESARAELVIQSNLVMQLLDEHGGSPSKTFDYIGRFAEALARNRGEYFQPRISHHILAPGVTMLLVEPPCGSNTAVLRWQDEYLFIDTGYACYRQEMLEVLRAWIPQWDVCKKSALITHADVDHCGLLDLFDTVWMSCKSRQSLIQERTDQGGLREQNPLHAPYIRICKLLTDYQPPAEGALKVLGGDLQPLDQPLQQIGVLHFGPLEFCVLEGAGGHLPGEILLLEKTHHILFSGDIYINIKETTQEQTAYNRYAPYLMTSVDTDPKLAAAEREALRGWMQGTGWRIFGGHGPVKLLDGPQARE